MDAKGALNRETATTKATVEAKGSPRRRFLLSRFAVALAASFAAACAGSVPREQVQAPPWAPPPPLALSSPPGAVARSVAPPESAPAPAAPQAAFDQAPRAPRPESRPGLGTEWGEARYSPTHDVPFTRADDARPLATTELRYDDERGVEALASYAAGRGERAHTWSAAGGAITIWLAGGDGDPLDVVEAGGHTFVIGEAGERYSIFLENHTGHRFEAVATVDGLDVIDGSPGALENRGYLLMPYATLEIDGFRRSEASVAAFRFGRVKDSYAAKMGASRNVGVIGVAFFAERGDDWGPGAYDEVRRRATANPFPGASY
jgi:hypothetical protein